MSADLAHHLDGLAHHAAIFFRRQIIRVDGRMGKRIRRGETDRPPAFRPQLARMHCEAILLRVMIAMIHHDGIHEVQLDVRHRQAFA